MLGQGACSGRFIVNEDIPVVRLQDQDELSSILVSLQKALLKHPEATQALLHSLAEEGKRFAETTEGKQLQQSLVQSELLRRLSRVWEATSLWIFDPVNTTDILPSAYLDALTQAAMSEDLEGLMADTLAGTEQK